MIQTTLQLPPDLAEDLGALKSFMEEERSRRVPVAAIWSLVVTIAISAASAVWVASATYHEVASLRATVDKWEPRLEELTKLGPLQDQIHLLQEQVGVLQQKAATLPQAAPPHGSPRAGR